MAVTVYKLETVVEQIDMLDPAATLQYLALRSQDEAEARVAVNAASPATYYGLSKRSIQMTEQGGGVWAAVVVYRLLEGSPLPAGFSGPLVPPPGVPFPPPGSPGGPPAPPAVTAALDETYAFQTSGGTVHVTQSVRTVHRVKRGGGTADDHKGTIGVRTGQEPAGCDIFVGKLELTMTKAVPTVSMAYVKKLRDLTGTVNTGEFYHNAAGEVLFLGATGQTRGPEDVGGWTVTYHFMLSPNLVLGGDTTDVTDPLVLVPDSTNGAGDGLVVPSKDGWDYLWVQYEPEAPEGSETGVKQVPRAAYTEQVYRHRDFNELGIG